MGYTYRYTDLRERFMNYAVETGSGAAIYIPGFIKIGSGIRKLIRGYINTKTKRKSHKHTLRKYTKNVPHF
jgi:hypothetical protein